MGNEHLATEAVASKVLGLAAEIADQGKTVSAESVLRDLGFDDISAIELVMSIEDDLEIDIDVSEYDNAPEAFLSLTLQALVDVTMKALGENPFDPGVRAGLPVEGAKPEVGQVWRSRSGDLVTIKRVNSFGAFPVISTDGNAYRRDGVSCMSVGFANGGDLIDRVYVPVPKDGNKAADGGPVGEHAPKLTPADIEAVIVSEHYFTAGQGDRAAVEDAAFSGGAFHASASRHTPHELDLVTVCVLLLRNGAKVTGVNHGPVSAANFDAAKGREYARENAIEKVWELEGYALRERLAAPVVSASFLLNATPEQEADLLEKLRKAPSAGIFLTALDTDAGTAVAALLQAAEAMRAFTDPEGNMPADTGEFNDLKEALAVADGVLAGNAQAMDGGPNPHYDPDADKGAKLLAIMRAFVDLYRVSCPETIHQTDRVIEKAGGLVEKLCDVAGYYRDQDDEAEEAQP